MCAPEEALLASQVPDQPPKATSNVKELVGVQVAAVVSHHVTVLAVSTVLLSFTSKEIIPWERLSRSVGLSHVIELADGVGISVVNSQIGP